MSIYQDDIKLMAAQRMSDTEDGGGRISGKPIIDGEHNSMFTDISDLDRAYGAVNMAKSFLHVTSEASEAYLGANVSLLSTPQDPNVSITLMSTHDHYDQRKDAQDMIERYLARSIRFDGRLLGTQLQGQRVIMLQQRVGAALPEINTTLVLVQDENSVNEQEQYVRIIRVDSEVREFTEIRNNTTYVFKRQLLSCEISEPLRYTFEGAEASDLDTTNGRTAVRETSVANAAKYYGTAKLKQGANFADMTIRADGIFSQLVPSSRTETPVVDLSIAATIPTLLATGDGPISYATTSPIAPQRSLFVGSAVLPGTLSIIIGSATLQDDNGTLKLADLALGTIDYAQGILQFAGNCPDYGSQTKTISYSPAAAPLNYNFSDLFDISAENRGYAYTKTFEYAPAPGSLVVNYMVGGKWYELSDGGMGVLSGSDASVGTGTINYQTGSLVLTLGALPDVDSAILYRWGIEATTVDRSDLLLSSPWFEYQLNNQQVVDPNSVVIRWEDNSITLADNSLGSLQVNPVTGLLRWQPLNLPIKGSVFTIDWDYHASQQQALTTLNDNGEQYQLTLGQVLHAGSISFQLQAENLSYGALFLGSPGKTLWRKQYHEVVVKDDANGKLLAFGHEVGSVDYSSGELLLNKSLIVNNVPKNHWYTLLHRVSQVSFESLSMSVVAGQEIELSFALPSTIESQQQSYHADQLQLTMALRNDESLSADSLVFSLNGADYRESNGKLYWQTDPQTGIGQEVGSVDLYNGSITLSDWQPGSWDFKFKVLFTRLATIPYDSKVVFRTPGAPLAPQSLYIDIPSLGSATADENGQLIGTGINGSVDYQTGVVQLNTASGIDVSTVRYNCVIYNYLPLDADLIGLDPVRLPSDGRVPIFRKGDVVVVHQSEQRTEANLSANQTLDCGKTRCAELYLRDDAGQLIDASLFNTDPDAGTLTTAADFPNSDVSLHWRWEDLVLLTDVDISGELRLAKPLSHDYEPGKALVSSVCIAGDLWARYSQLFDQQTWTGVWSDNLLGDATSAAFNDADFPLQLSNDGAITERWAIIFTSNIAFKVVGEHVGQIAVGDINSDCAPINPNSGKAYFLIPSQGWGSGWATGNVLRFNSDGAIFPFWSIRTILQSDATVIDDQFALQLRGNVNKQQ